MLDLDTLDTTPVTIAITRLISTGTAEQVLPPAPASDATSADGAQRRQTAVERRARRLRVLRRMGRTRLARQRDLEQSDARTAQQRCAARNSGSFASNSRTRVAL